MKELINKRIINISIDEKNGLIKFLTEDALADKKEIVYGVQGDCCSEAWFDQIIGISNLKAHGWNNKPEKESPRVIEFQDLYLGDTELRTHQEVDDVHGIILVLETKQHIFLTYRNSSNGYYGGWISCYEGKDTLKYFEDVKFVELKDDYYSFLKEG